METATAEQMRQAIDEQLDKYIQVCEERVASGELFPMLGGVMVMEYGCGLHTALNILHHLTDVNVYPLLMQKVEAEARKFDRE